MIRPALLAALLAAFPLAHAATDLTTFSERSGFQQTGHYDEVVRLCTAFQQAYPRQVKCIQFGTTPEGRPMLALVANNTGALTPQAAKKQGLPVTLVQGGIHAGEIDGKDAGFLALREVLEGRLAKGALDRQVLVFVPVFNVDGHERFAKWNRPNQRGPVEMGWRTTAQNFNLNRDYVKGDAPEMQAMLALVNAWDPLTCVDLHVTDGAMFQHDVSIQVEPVNSGDAQFRKDGLALRTGVIGDISKQGSSPQSYYMSFVKTDDPSSGFSDLVYEPRFSTGYFQLRNRISLLVETHSWKDYPTRVRVTHDVLAALIGELAEHGGEWQKLARAADADPVAGKPQILERKEDRTKPRMIEFPGYAFKRFQSPVSGQFRVVYDPTRPEVWKIPFYDTLVPAVTATPPRAGYFVPAAWLDVAQPLLDAHGIHYRRVPTATLAVQAYRASDVKLRDTTFEGRTMATVTG